jgi:hypothetical protein
MNWNKIRQLKDVSTREISGKVVIVLIVIFCQCCVVNTKQDVVLQIIMPFRSTVETKYQSTHVLTKERIKHGREVEYRNLRRQFTINSWLDFTKTESPSEILSLFCNEVFTKPVNTILSLNHGAGTEASNNYILKLADHLGYPVISWDPHYPGALQVCFVFMFSSSFKKDNTRKISI